MTMMTPSGARTLADLTGTVVLVDGGLTSVLS